jgi:transposase
LLLPEAVDDYVGPDNPVRFIDAFVDGLDLVAASFTRVEAKVTGRPGYAPANLVQAEMLKPLLPRAFPFQHAFSKTLLF